MCFLSHNQGQSGQDLVFPDVWKDKGHQTAAAHVWTSVTIQRYEGKTIHVLDGGCSLQQGAGVNDVCWERKEGHLGASAEMGNGDDCWDQVKVSLWSWTVMII